MRVHVRRRGSAPALGIARHAIDAFVEGAARRATRRHNQGGDVEAPKQLRDDVYVEDAAGRAETLLAAVAISRTYEAAGRLLLGLEPLRWLF